MSSNASSSRCCIGIVVTPRDEINVRTEEMRRAYAKSQVDYLLDSPILMRKLYESSDEHTRDKYIRKYHMEYLFAAADANADADVAHNADERDNDNNNNKSSQKTNSSRKDVSDNRQSLSNKSVRIHGDALGGGGGGSSVSSSSDIEFADGALRKHQHRQRLSLKRGEEQKLVEEISVQQYDDASDELDEQKI